MTALPSKSVALLRTASMQEGEQKIAPGKKPTKASKIDILNTTTIFSKSSGSFLKGIFSDDPIHNPPMPYSACGSGLFLNNFSRERAIAKMEREAKIQKMSEISLALRNQGITQQIARFKERELELRLSSIRQKEMMEEYERMKAEALNTHKPTEKKPDPDEQGFSINKKHFNRLMKITKNKHSLTNLSYNVKYESVQPRSRVCNFRGRGHHFEDLLGPLDTKLRPSLALISYKNLPERKSNLDFSKMLGRSSSTDLSPNNRIQTSNLPQKPDKRSNTPNTVMLKSKSTTIYLNNPTPHRRERRGSTQHSSTSSHTGQFFVPTTVANNDRYRPIPA